MNMCTEPANRNSSKGKFPMTANRVSGFAILLAGLLSTSVPAAAESLAELGRRTHYHGIAFARSGSAELLLATHHGLYAVAADGAVTQASLVQDYMGFSAHPSDPLVYFASGHPEGGGNSGFLKSSDGGATWTKLSDGVDGPVDFHQMDVSPADPATIYGAYGALQVSRDGGATWQIAGNPPAGLIAIAASSLNAQTLYAATKRGLYRSEDSGASFSLLAFDGQAVSAVESGPGGALYVFVVGRGLVKADESASDSWTELSNRFGEAVPLHIAIDDDASHLALTTHTNAVMESRDGGMTWAPFGRPQGQ
jgi:photosystem II stability/assembly factor-like uncharacterized protein